MRFSSNDSLKTERCTSHQRLKIIFKRPSTFTAETRKIIIIIIIRSRNSRTADEKSRFGENSNRVLIYKRLCIRRVVSNGPRTFCIETLDKRSALVRTRNAVALAWVNYNKRVSKNPLTRSTRQRRVSPSSGDRVVCARVSVCMSECDRVKGTSNATLARSTFCHRTRDNVSIDDQ